MVNVTICNSGNARPMPSHIHHGQAEPRRCCDGQHGIDAARLHGHGRVDLAARNSARTMSKMRLVFRAADALFAQNGWRAHHGDGHDQRVVGHLLRRSSSVTGPHSLHRADGHQFADIGITAAARAQQRAAPRAMSSISLNTDLSQCFLLSFRSSLVAGASRYTLIQQLGSATDRDTTMPFTGPTKKGMFSQDRHMKKEANVPPVRQATNAPTR